MAHCIQGEGKGYNPQVIRCLLKGSKKSVPVNKIHKAIYSFVCFCFVRKMPAVRFNILCGREHWVMKEKKLVNHAGMSWRLISSFIYMAVVSTVCS